MKKLIIILIGAFLVVSCNNNGKDSSDSSESPGKTKTETSDTKSCDDFLKDYEKWVDEVIIVYKKIKDNPMDLTNTTKALEASEKMAEYANKWSTLYDCANTKKYVRKMEELEKKLDEAINQ